MIQHRDEVVLILLELLKIDTKGLEEVIITARPNEFRIDCKYTRYGLDIDCKYTRYGLDINEKTFERTLEQTLKHYELIEKEDE